MAGRLVSSVEGRERPLAVASAVLLTGGTFLLSTLSAETGAAVAVIYVLVMGAGVGGLYTLAGVAVQNAVPHTDVGAATAAVQFQRAVGGTMGVAVLGAMMARRTAARLTEEVPASVRELLPEGWLGPGQRRQTARRPRPPPTSLPSSFRLRVWTAPSWHRK